MTWLLKFYPPRWRRRYAHEIAEIIAAQPFSIGVAMDLMAGAIDAWFHPQWLAPATPDSAPTAPLTKGDAPMIARMMQLRCAGCGPDLRPGDKVKSNAVMIGGTLLLALLWLVTTWQSRKNIYVLALWPMTYCLPYLVGLRYTSLKGRSARTQTILIAGVGAALTAFFLLVAWIGTRL